MKAQPPGTPIQSPKGKLRSAVTLPTLTCDKARVNKSFLDFVSSQNSLTHLSLSVNDSAGTKSFDECYDKEELLGQGGFADVFRCRHKVREHDYAVKEIYHDTYENDGDFIRIEINAMKRLRDGCHIIGLLDVFSEPDRTLVIMEQAMGGDLLERIYKKEVFDEPDARRVSRLLLEAVCFCHKKKVAHRDIKPENILLTSQDSDTNIKLADFGCSKFITGPNCLHSLCGSVRYSAPELYTHEEGYSEKCDLWSVGVVIYILLGGYAPFDGEEEDMENIICAGTYTFHDNYWKDISDDAKHVVRRLLALDPEERATPEEALDSEWLRRRDMESLNLDGSCSTFDAWVRRQNESSQTISLNRSYLNGSSSANFEVDMRSMARIDSERIDVGNLEDDVDDGSLTIGDL